MARSEQDPTREILDDGPRRGEVRETHPAFGRVVMHRISGGASSLFDSDVRHDRFVRMSIHHADRTRGLHRDWIRAESRPVVEVDMSEAQWAAMVSSFNDGGGTSCTLRATETQFNIPGIPFESRLALSVDETRSAARAIKDRIDAALAAVEEKPTKANIRSLRIAVDQAESNVVFAADSLTEHAEEVVQKARADIEAMVDQRAAHLGLAPADRPVIRELLGGD